MALEVKLHQKRTGKSKKNIYGDVFELFACDAEFDSNQSN